MRTTKTAFLAAVCLIVLAACQTLIPKTFNERLATGYVTVTTVRQTTTSLLVARKISADDAQNVQNQANLAREGLDLAQKLNETIPMAAEDKLSATLVILQSLESYLAAKK